MSDSSSAPVAEPLAAQDPGGSAASRRKLRNEDSSYDSDFEPTSPLGDAHDNVCRTVSDTLGAEFAEYVTLHDKGKTLLQEKGIPPAGVPALEAPPTADSGAEAQQVEFGVKLGYPEALVKRVLQKLGGSPAEDELLAELIRLAPPAQECEEAAPEAAGSKEDAEVPLLRDVIIDGSNVAMSHGKKLIFSCRGIRLCVDWFRERGHKKVTAFVPMWRKETATLDAPISDQEVLLELERENVLVFTPSRTCSGKRIVAYDDRYILNEAAATGGVVVSNDNYRDLAAESVLFRRIVEESILMYSWVNGRFVPPDDPLGRNGPSLDAFLRHSSSLNPSLSIKQQPCPYGQRCTYGNKCKYMHPERGALPIKSVTERLKEQAPKHKTKAAPAEASSSGESLRAKSLSLPVLSAEKKSLSRNQSSVPAVPSSVPSTLGVSETVSREPFQGPVVTTVAAPVLRAACGSDRENDQPIGSLAGIQVFKGDVPSTRIPIAPGQTTPSWSWNLKVAPVPQSSMYGAHMAASKQAPDAAEAMPSTDNAHQKLKRHPAINPMFDHRLYNMLPFKDQSAEFFQSVVGSVSSAQVSKDSEILSLAGERCSGYSSVFSSGKDPLHRPLARLTSLQETTLARPLVSVPTMYAPCFHPQVTRYSSAPDPMWGGTVPQGVVSQGPHAMSRISSTSDTHLNVYRSDSAHFPVETYDETRLHPYTTIAPSPRPIGSRPISPPNMGASSVSAFPGTIPFESFYHSSKHFSEQRRNTLDDMPAMCPAGSQGHEDARFIAYSKLSQHLPEAQARALLARYPEETDPERLLKLLNQ